MNKQILTDIVNSILGLSKKKKKEFIELLDDGINGVSEQLNETVEQVDQKINSIEPSDFEENDETKSSFIKNRPFYDYDEIKNNLTLKKEQFNFNTEFYGQTIRYNGLILGISMNNINDIRLCLLNYSDVNSTIISFNKLLNCRYKINKNDSKIYNSNRYYSLVNYYNEEPLKANIVISNNVIGPNKVYCRLSDSETMIIGISYENNYIRNTDGGVRYQQKDYEYSKFYCLDDLEYYEGDIETEHHFKSLDEKYIPDTIKNRITALEQAVTALGGTLNT